MTTTTKCPLTAAELRAWADPFSAEFASAVLAMNKATIGNELGRGSLLALWLADALEAKEKAEAERAALKVRDALWSAYSNLLAAELHGLVGIAVAHGWPGNEHSFREGKRLREALGIEPFSAATADRDAAQAAPELEG